MNIPKPAYTHKTRCHIWRSLQFSFFESTRLLTDFTLSFSCIGLVPGWSFVASCFLFPFLVPISSNIPLRNELRIFHPKEVQAENTHASWHVMESAAKHEEWIRDLVVYEVVVARSTAYHSVYMHYKCSRHRNKPWIIFFYGCRPMLYNLLSLLPDSYP